MMTNSANQTQVDVADLLYTDPVEPETVTGMTEEEYDVQLPSPAGYRILIALPTQKETFGEDGMIVKAGVTKHIDHLMSIVGLVIEVGPQAYKDQSRFSEGPWCKAGDYVMFRANSGTRFMFAGGEYRIMNDDSIEAVVPDPTAISRV